jgi:hypothetical protein
LTGDASFNNIPILQIGLKYCASNVQLYHDHTVREKIDRFCKKIIIKQYWKEAERLNPTVHPLIYSPLIKLPPSDWNPPNPNPFISFILNNLKNDLLQKINTQALPRQSHIKDGYQSTLTELLNNPSIRVVPSDKNMGLCIMPTEMYRRITQAALSDPGKYRRLSQFRVDRLTREAEETKVYAIISLQGGRFRNWVQALHYIRAADPNSFSVFYTIPKLHKAMNANGDPLTRPITGTKPDNIQYRISKVIGIWLNVQIFNISNSPILKNSMELVDALKLPRYQSIQGDIMFSCDIVNMYGEIRLGDLYTKIRRAMQLTSENDMFLIRQALGNNIFTWAGEYYEQIEGIAMGAPAAAAAANLYMFLIMDKPLLARYRNTGKLILYRRYIDDSFGIFRGTLLEYYDMIGFVRNTLRQSGLEITEKNSYDEIDFLDVVLYKPAPNFPIATKVFQKPGNTYQYLTYHSSHPDTIKRGFIRGELIRYKRICSLESDYNTIRSALWQRLRLRGYPRDYLLPIFRRNHLQSTLPNPEITPTTLSLNFTRNPINGALHESIRIAEMELRLFNPEIRLLLTFKMKRNTGSLLISSPLRENQLNYINDRG